MLPLIGAAAKLGRAALPVVRGAKGGWSVRNYAELIRLWSLFGPGGIPRQQSIKKYGVPSTGIVPRIVDSTRGPVRTSSFKRTKTDTQVDNRERKKRKRSLKRVFPRTRWRKRRYGGSKGAPRYPY